MHHKLAAMIEQLKQIYEMPSVLSEINEDIGNHSVEVIEGFRETAIDAINEIEGNLDLTRTMLEDPDFLAVLDNIIEGLETAGELEDAMYKDTDSSPG